MPVQPLTHLWMLVGGVVVEDHVHDFFDRHLRLNGVQEADELLVTMALHTLANDLAFEDIESSEQRRCAMALVVVGHRAGSAFLHRQAGLGEHHNTLGDIRPEWWDARGSCLITQKTVVTRLHEAFLPAPHTGLRLAGPAHNLIGADTVCAQQDDLGPPDMLMRCVAIPYDRAQTAAINRLEKNGNSGSHAPDLHATSQTGIPSR